MLHRIKTVSGNSLHSGNCVSSIKGSALVKHCYTSLLMHNMLACYYRCKEDKLCQSLNFYEKKNLCELNNRTRAVGSLNFLSHADSVYLDNPFRATLGSFFELSAASCQEIKNSSGGLVPSGRYWLKGESENKPFIAYCDMERGVIVECTGNPCQNGGTCDYQGEGQYACQCSQGYRGRNCELDECSSNPCLNGGTCNATVNGFTCACAPLATGVHCELGVGEGCDSYLTNTDLDRSVHKRSLNGFQKCDNALLEGWYRFNSATGARIPDYCVNRYMCTTHASGWLNGTQPSLQEGAVNRTVCFHWNSGCCQWSKTIMVRNCGPFFTYRLVPPGYCYLRYCVTDATP